MDLAGHEYDERKLIYRVLANMRKVKTGGRYRWAAVMAMFGLGSTVAKALCLEFQFDPDERVLK
jgi:hypothetical protein